MGTTNAVQELEAHEQFDFDHLADRLEGNSGFRTSIPKAQDDTGLEKYVWRMARFYGGDTTQPVTAHFKLQDWIDEELEADVSVTGILDDDGKEVIRRVDKMACEIIDEHFDMDSTRMARRMEKAGLI